MQDVSPIVEELADELTAQKVGKINIEEQPELAEAFSVMSIPTLMVIKNGKVVSKATEQGPSRPFWICWRNKARSFASSLLRILLHYAAQSSFYPTANFPLFRFNKKQSGFFISGSQGRIFLIWEIKLNCP